MMDFPGPFINGAGAWQLDSGEPTAFEEGFDVPINSGNAQTRDLGSRGFQNLLRRQRPAGPFEGFANGGPPTGTPLVSFRHPP